MKYASGSYSGPCASKLRGIFSWCTVAVLVACGSAWATKYYLNSSVATNGTGTKNNPWNSIASVNNFNAGGSPPGFSPGDVIYLAQGTTTFGQLSPRGNGAPGNPIIIDCYFANSTLGSAKPVVDASGANTMPPSAAVWLSDQSYWTIQNLSLKNWWDATTLAAPPYTTMQQRWGIRVTTSNTNITSLPMIRDITIRNNEISYVFASNGRWGPPGSAAVIGVGHLMKQSYTPGLKSLFENILIEGNQISDVFACGIWFNCSNPEASFNAPTPPGPFAWQNWNNLSKFVVVRSNTVTRGQDGIIVMGTDNELIEFNTVDQAGVNSLDNSVLVGIQVQRHIGGCVQYNEVRNTPFHIGSGDRQAFDNDQALSGTTVFQYNYSHNNGGGFFEECGPLYAREPDDAASNPHSIVRYNISQNDGVSSPDWYLANSRGNTLVYNNVFYSIYQFRVIGDYYGTPLNNVYSNNSFIGGAGSSMTAGSTYDHNCYMGMTPPNGDPNAVQPIGNADPLFFNPGNATDGFSSAKQCYKLIPGSPCKNAGTAIGSSGGRDFWGKAINGLPEIGAFEFPSIVPILGLLLN